MNRVYLSGNLVQEPKIIGGEMKVLRNAIAVKNPYAKDKTDFINIVAFQKTAEFIEKYLEKGRRVIIEGHLQTSTYTTKDGEKRTSMDIVADQIEFADSKHKIESPF